MKIATCIHRHCAKIQKVIFCTQASLHVTSGAGGDVVADVSYSRWVRKRMYFDISITHNTLHHRGQSRGQRGEETSFILTPAQLHSINIVKLRQGSGKDWQGMAHKAKGLKASTLA